MDKIEELKKILIDHGLRSDTLLLEQITTLMTGDSSVDRVLDETRPTEKVPAPQPEHEEYKRGFIDGVRTQAPHSPECVCDKCVLIRQSIQPEHKSMEELRKRFNTLFTNSYAGDSGIGGNCPQESEYSWATDNPKDVFDFFTPYIEPKNTSELEIEFRERYKYADCTQLLKNSIWNFFEPHLKGNE